MDLILSLLEAEVEIIVQDLIQLVGLSLHQEAEMDTVTLEFLEALEAEEAKGAMETKEDILHLKVSQVQKELETDLNHNLIEVTDIQKTVKQL